MLSSAGREFICQHCLFTITFFRCLHIPYHLCFGFYIFCLLQNVGTLWYFLTIEREDACWRSYCYPNDGCHSYYLYCSDKHNGSYGTWVSGSGTQVFNMCNGSQDNPFNFGIYEQALVSGILGPGNFISKICYCFWWGLQNLRYSLVTVVCEISRYVEFKCV